MSLYTFQYGLLYKTAKQTGVTPEIIFVIAMSNFRELSERLTVYLTRDNLITFAQKYLHTQIIQFALGDKDVFDEARFGFGECGYISVEQDTTQIHVRIDHSHLHNSILTMYVLCAVLSVNFSTQSREAPRQISLHVCVGDITKEWQGHSVGGAISISIINWLRKYHRRAVAGGGVIGTIHPNIIAAMREVYQGKDKSEITGYVDENGGFSLCYGETCELRTQPIREMNIQQGYVELYSHNLDTAEQQVVLFAGLAVLCQRAHLRQ